MKKSLMTALFAGTMLISNDVCANNILNQNGDQENQAHHEQIEVNAQQGQEQENRKRTCKGCN